MISKRKELRQATVFKSTLSFLGFSSQNVVPFVSPSTSIDSRSSVSHAASLSAVPPEVQLDKLEMRAGPSGEGVAEVVRTVTPRTDSVIPQVWRSLGFSGLQITKTHLTPISTAVSVSKPTPLVYATPSP